MDRHTTHVCAVHTSHAPQSLYRKRHRTVPYTFTSRFLLFSVSLEFSQKTSFQKNVKFFCAITALCVWLGVYINKKNSKHILITLFFAITSVIPLKLFLYLFVFQSSLSLLHLLHILLFLFPSFTPALSSHSHRPRPTHSPPSTLPHSRV